MLVLVAQCDRVLIFGYAAVDVVSAFDITVNPASFEGTASSLRVFIR